MLKLRQKIRHIALDSKVFINIWTYFLGKYIFSFRHYIGLHPNTEYLKGQVALNRWGYIITDQKMQTSIAGVFAAGDVRDTEMRQVATAIGDGAVAVSSAQHFIEKS